jgi:hypothetical protein
MWHDDSLGKLYNATGKFPHNSQANRLVNTSTAFSMNDYTDHPRRFQFSLRQLFLIVTLFCAYIFTVNLTWYDYQILHLLSLPAGAICSWAIFDRRYALLGGLICGTIAPLLVHLLDPYNHLFMLIIFFNLLGGSVGAIIGRACAGRRGAIVGMLIVAFLGPFLWFLVLILMWPT